MECHSSAFHPNSETASHMLWTPENHTQECLIRSIMPQTLSGAVSPLIAWSLIVVFATTFKNGLLDDLAIKKSLAELTTVRNSPLAILDVFRVIAIIWVMANHTGSEGRIDILDRLPSAQAFKSSIHHHPVFGALLGNSALGVEIFLVLSGILGALSWLRKSHQPFWRHYTSSLARRWLRLFPSIAVFVYFAYGPIMKALLPRFHSSMISACGLSGIVLHLTFLGNWQVTPTCMGYLWYLGLDMQLQILAPFLLHKLHTSPVQGWVIGVTLAGCSAVFRALYCLSYGICNKSDVDIPFISYPGQDPTTLAKIYAGLWEMYARPYTKCGPFVIGLFLGYIFHKANFQISMQKSKALFASSFILAIATIYGILPEYWHPTQGNTVYNTLYTALFRTVFAFAVAVMIIAFVLRKDRCQVHQIWSVLARLTFSAYLLHMPIVYVFNHVHFLQEATSPFHLMVVVPFVACLSFVSAFIFYVFVESPLGRLSTVVLKYIL